VPCLPGAAFHAITRQDPEAWRWLAVLALRRTTLVFGLLGDLLIRDTCTRCAAFAPGGVPRAPCSGRARRIFVTQEQLAKLDNISRTALGEVLHRFEAEFPSPANMAI
jgi:hypothetical protein